MEAYCFYNQEEKSTVDKYKKVAIDANRVFVLWLTAKVDEYLVKGKPKDVIHNLLILLGFILCQHLCD
jgi:hypothetical protein